MGNYQYATCSLALCTNQFDASPTCRYHAKMVPNYTMLYDINSSMYWSQTVSTTGHVLVYLRYVYLGSHSTCETCVSILVYLYYASKTWYWWFSINSVCDFTTVCDTMWVTVHLHYWKYTHVWFQYHFDRKYKTALLTFCTGNSDSVISTVTKTKAGQSGVQFPTRVKMFLYKAYRQALGPI
jgi:hypothetical protein